MTQVKSEITVAKQRQHADLTRIVKILRDVNYRGYVVLEYEAEESPLKAVPRYLDELRKLIR